MNRKERIEKVLAESPEASADEVARTLVDQDVAAGQYEGCSSELEGWYGEYENAARDVLAGRRTHSLDVTKASQRHGRVRSLNSGGLGQVAAHGTAGIEIVMDSGETLLVIDEANAAEWEWLGDEVAS